MNAASRFGVDPDRISPVALGALLSRLWLEGASSNVGAVFRFGRRVRHSVESLAFKSACKVPRRELVLRPKETASNGDGSWFDRDLGITGGSASPEIVLASVGQVFFRPNGTTSNGDGIGFE